MGDGDNRGRGALETLYHKRHQGYIQQDASAPLTGRFSFCNTKRPDAPSQRRRQFGNALWLWPLTCLAEDRPIERIVEEKASCNHIVENRPHGPYQPTQLGMEQQP